MKKVIVGLSIALLAFGAMGCHKERRNANVTAANAAEAPVAAETILTIEAMIQSNDAAASDPSTALTCKYVLISGTSMSVAEVKTSGKCNFNELKGQAAAAGSFNNGAQILSIINADSSLPASSKAKWDCKAINVVTNHQSVGAQDCKNGQGVKDATGKALANALGL